MIYKLELEVVSSKEIGETLDLIVGELRGFPTNPLLSVNSFKMSYLMKAEIK